MLIVAPITREMRRSPEIARQIEGPPVRAIETDDGALSATGGGVMRHIVLALALSVGLVVVGCASEEDEGTGSSQDHLEKGGDDEGSDDEGSDSKSSSSGGRKGEPEDGRKCNSTNLCPKGQRCVSHFCQYNSASK